MATHLTVIQALPSLSAGLVAWLMVRLGASTKTLAVRSRGRCPSCGRRRTHRGCRCTA